MPSDEAQETLEESSITFELHGHIEVHDGLYTSFCDELPLIGIGGSPEDAISNFLGCLKEYSQLCAKHGYAEKMFERRTQQPGRFALTLPSPVEAERQPVAA